MPVTDYYEMQYGTLEVAGDTVYALVRAEGFAEFPELRTYDSERARQHGEVFGDDYLNKRVLLLQLEAHALTDDQFNDQMRALQLAFRPGSEDRALTFRLPGVAGGGIRTINARPRKFDVPIERERWYHRMPIISVQLECSDPRIYSADETVRSTTLPVGGGGLIFPLTFPVEFDDVSGGRVQVPNEGTFPTLPTITVFGPCVVPKITHTETNRFLQFDISIPSGSFLELDFSTRTVLLNGTGNRYRTLIQGSEWFEFSPGDNELRFNAASGEDASLQVRYRSAWL